MAGAVAGLLGAFAHRPLLNSLFRVRLDDPVYENPSRVDLVGIKCSQRNYFLDFCDGYTAAHGHQGIEIPGRSTVDQVARGVSLPGFYKGDIGHDSSFHDIGRAIEIHVWFAFSHDRANSRAGVKPRDTRTTLPAYVLQACPGV